MDQVPVAKPAPEKAPKKPAVKPAVKKEGKTVEFVKDESLDPVADKLRQQRLVEDTDNKSTTEPFANRGGEKTFDNFIPKCESYFIEYAELVSHKLRPHELHREVELVWLWEWLPPDSYAPENVEA